MHCEIKKAGFGLQINDRFFGCYGYADDLALMAPSREALQEMVNICSRYFDYHGIKISTHHNIRKTKTKVIVFGIQD